MTHYICYCKNCEVQYTWQGSGNYYTLETPHEYNDKDHCPTCKKAIVDALKLIPKINKIVYIPTDEVDLKTLLRWEEEMKIEHEEKMKQDKYLFPLCKQIFANAFNEAKGGFSKYGIVEGKGEFRKKYFSYSYWPNEVDQAIIKVKARINIKTKEIVDYK